MKETSFTNIKPLYDSFSTISLNNFQQLALNGIDMLIGIYDAHSTFTSTWNVPFKHINFYYYWYHYFAAPVLMCFYCCCYVAIIVTLTGAHGGNEGIKKLSPGRSKLCVIMRENGRDRWNWWELSLALLHLGEVSTLSPARIRWEWRLTAYSCMAMRNKHSKHVLFS